MASQQCRAVETAGYVDWPRSDENHPFSIYCNQPRAARSAGNLV